MCVGGRSGWPGSSGAAWRRRWRGSAARKARTNLASVRFGGGALPLAELPSFACAIEESLAAPLRVGAPPVVGVVRDGALLLDCRTLSDGEVDEVADAVLAVR